MAVSIFSYLWLTNDGSRWLLYPHNNGVVDNQSFLSSEWYDRPQWAGTVIRAVSASDNNVPHLMDDQNAGAYPASSRLFPPLMTAIVALAEPDVLELVLHLTDCTLSGDVIRVSDTSIALTDAFKTANTNGRLIKIIYANGATVLGVRFGRFSTGGSWEWSHTLPAQWETTLEKMRDELRLAGLTVNPPSVSDSSFDALTAQIAAGFQLIQGGQISLADDVTSIISSVANLRQLVISLAESGDASSPANGADSSLVILDALSGIEQTLERLATKSDLNRMGGISTAVTGLAVAAAALGEVKPKNRLPNAPDVEQRKDDQTPNMTLRRREA